MPDVAFTHADVRFVPAMTAQGPAMPLATERFPFGAYGIAHVTIEGQPCVVLTIVNDGHQSTLTLPPQLFDQFCHHLADAHLEQTQQLRAPAPGKAVH